MRRPAIPAITMPLADQGVISVGTFLFNILLARAIPLGEYGRYAMILGVLSLMQGACGSLLFYPLSVRGAAIDEPLRRRLILSTVLVTLLACLPLAALLGVAVWCLVDGSLLLPTVAMLAAGQVQEAMRRGLLTGFRHGTAIWGDAVSYLGQAALVGLMSRYFGMSLATALWIMAATSLAAAALQAAQLSLRGTRPLPIGPVVADFWSIGRWSLTSNLLGLARIQSVPWLLAALTGPAAAGAFQLAMNLVNVANPIVTGVCNFVPQAASRALGSGYRAAWAASWPSIGAGLPLVGGLVALLMLAPAESLFLIYGGRADPSALVNAVRILAVCGFLNYAGNTACAYLHGVLGGRDALLADGASTLTMAVAGPPLVILLGLTGGAMALALALAIRASALGYFTAARILKTDASRLILQHDQTQETPA